MAVYPTALSLAAAAIYIGVSVLCMLAGTISLDGAARTSRLQPGWFSIAGLFVILALNRILVIEDRFDEYLRDVARESGAYEGRTAWQGPLSVIAILLVLLVVTILARNWARSRGDKRRQALGVAQLAAFAMLGLIALRLISFHPIDSLLYGGLRLNWWFDVGLSLLVGFAAWSGWKTSRDLPA